MTSLPLASFALVALSPLVGAAIQIPEAPDESPAEAGAWGFRPDRSARVERDPPPFVWRPQSKATAYDWQVARDEVFTKIVREREGLRFPAFRPSEPFGTGVWHWRFRYHTADGSVSAWSSAREFAIPDGVPVVGMPPFAELRERLPAGHPRLFVRPERRAELQSLATGELKTQFEALCASCDALIEKPPNVEEPPLYPDGTKRGSEEWRAIWWGNRRRTIAVLEPASRLAFVHWVSGESRHGDEAKRLLMATAAWDPVGATGYRYNDEAGMPYAYWFARTYTFLHDELSDAERERCLEVMRVRGNEILAHLAPRHIWRPYGSHQNRAWHFLGELGVAFHGEIEAADRWLEFAMTVFGTVYPVWSDADGGWHEGLNYWQSYLGRFTWWADVMREALGVDAYREPYFSRAGEFAMYVKPPGTRGGGFGDLTAKMSLRGLVELMAMLAQQAGNPHWQWYSEALGKRRPPRDFVTFLRSSRPATSARPPSERPTSKCFRGTGLAVLQTNLLDATDNVQVLLKSSPFGSQSHGYEAQNSFLLYAYGERLLIRSGRRDSYGSAHHRDWMWSTRSTNCVTVSGEGQAPHSRTAVGEIVEFATGDGFHYAEGEAGDAYAKGVESFRRSILLIEPDVVVVYDTLATAKSATFTWWLHAVEPFTVHEDQPLELAVGAARCDVHLLWPPALEVEQTDRFDPPPRPRVKLVEHHLTASTIAPATHQAAVTVIRPWRKGGDRPAVPELESTEGGFAIHVPGQGGATTVLLRRPGAAEVRGDGLRSDARVAAIRRGADPARFASGGGSLEDAE